MGARSAALNCALLRASAPLRRPERRAGDVDERIVLLDPSVRAGSPPAPGAGPDGTGESSGESSGELFEYSPEEELLLPCPAIEDDVQMVRAYEAIARKRAEYAPRYRACIKETERLQEMRRYIFCQSRALAQQMLASTGPYVVDVALGDEGGAEPPSDCENRGVNEHPPPTKKRPRPTVEPGPAAAAESAARDESAARCRTFGCTLAACHAGVHRFDRFADPPSEPAAVADPDFDAHALFDAPVASVRDSLLHGLRRMTRQPHAAPFRAAPAADSLACLDYVVARLEGWVYINAQQPFNDLDAIWSDAIRRCAPDSWTACYAHKLRGESETLRKAMVQRLADAAGR